MLTESEQKFRSLVEYSGTAVAISNLKGKFTYVNQALADLLGYSIDELVGCSFKDFIYPDDKRKIFTLFLNIIPLRRHPRELELRVLRKDGGIRYIWTKPTRYKVNGRLVGFHTIIVDITEKKMIEDKLRKSEESLAEAQRIAHLGNWDYRIENDELYWSDETYRIFGLAPQEFKATYDAFLKCVHPDEREFVKKSVEEALSGEKPYNIDHRIVLPDGSERIVHEQAEVFFNKEGKPIRMLGTVQDITERKQTIGALKESNEKLASIFASSPNAITVTDLDGNIIECNQATLDLHGFSSKDEVIGKSAFILIAKKDHTRALENLKKSLEEGSVKDIEFQFVSKDGREFPAELSASVITDSSGVPTAFVAVTKDITERKRMETVTKVREKLRRSPDISSGLNILLDRVLDDYHMDVGAVFLLDHDENVISLRGFKSRLQGIRVAEIFPFDNKCVELQSLVKKKSISQVVGEDEKSILGMRSVHCTPVVFGHNTYGILCLGSEKDLIMSSSNLSGLSLYSELVSTLFEMQSIKIAPAKEIVPFLKRRYTLEPGCSYLVENDVEQSFEIFMDNVLSGIEGLCITRKFPLKVREKYGLEKTPIVWLSEEKVEGQTIVYSLVDLSVLINDFLEKAKQSIVLVDGFEYLIANHGFESFLHFLQITRNRFDQNGSILIAPIFVEALDVKELKLIEREMIPCRELSDDLSNLNKEKRWIKQKKSMDNLSF